MVRKFGGVFGPFAFLVALLHYALHPSGDVQSALWHAWTGMLVFTVLGLFFGLVAQRLADEMMTRLPDAAQDTPAEATPSEAGETNSDAPTESDT